MAARTKAQIVQEAQAIAGNFGVSINAAGANAGDCSAPATKPSMTWEQAMIRLQLLQLELLANIRESETNP
jgi:cyanate permease